MATRKRARPITAGESVARFETDPRYEELRARLRQQDAERERQAAEWRRAEVPLLSDLAAAGYHVRSVWELYKEAPYPAAVPILLSHLPRDYPIRVREGIAYAMAASKAKDAGPALVRLFVEERDEHVKEAIASALGAIADRKIITDVIGLVRDRHHGSSRVLLLRALTRSRDPRAHDTIVDLARDPDLEKEVRVILHSRERRRSAKS